MDIPPKYTLYVQKCETRVRFFGQVFGENVGRSASRTVRTRKMQGPVDRIDDQVYNTSRYNSDRKKGVLTCWSLRRVTLLKSSGDEKILKGLTPTLHR